MTWHHQLTGKFGRPYWAFLLLISFVSCKDDENPDPVAEETSQIVSDVYDVMKEWYFWNEELPEVDLTSYSTPENLLEALRKKPVDRWTHIEDAEAYDQLYNEGKFEGYGVQFGWDEEGVLRIAYVFEDSPFYQAGVRRTWKVLELNGAPIPTEGFDLPEAENSFTFEDPEGNVITKTFTKKEVQINTVLYKEIITVGDKKVGYLVFKSFLETSRDELNAVFQEFKNANISELILDLRYNGGGRVRIAEYLASDIVGNAGIGKNFYQYVFNADKTEENEEVKFLTPDIPLDLSRLFVISSKATASASELIINGLRPFLDLIVIGDDTYGKPVGSYGFKLGEYVLNPICFAVLNHDGYGYYFDGLKADAYITDDLTHDFGSREELRLREALFYIENGNFSDAGSRQLPVQRSKHSFLHDKTELKQVIGAF